MWAPVLLLGAFATCASAQFPLNVSIAVIDNTWVVANITNIGSSDIKLRKIGILDDLPTQKVRVFKAGVELPFQGIHVFRHFGSSNSDDNTTVVSAWQSLAAGQSIDTTFDIAITHDLSAGGTFEINSEGQLPYTDVRGSSTTLDLANFTSNTVIVPIDGGHARKMYQEHAFNSIKRSDILDAPFCRSETVQNSFLKCSNLASHGAYAAWSRDDLMLKFFKTTDPQVRNMVANVFDKISATCNARIFDPYAIRCPNMDDGTCKSGAIAYVHTPTDSMAACPLFFTWAEDDPTCYGNGARSGILIHEMTHISSIQGTIDHAYGEGPSLKLDTLRSLYNADSYRYFLRAANHNC